MMDYERAVKNLSVDVDAAAPARGCFFGALLGALIWGLIFLIFNH